MDQKDFSDQIFFGNQNIFQTKIFLPKIFSDPKYFLDQNYFFRSKIYLYPNFFGIQNLYQFYSLMIFQRLFMSITSTFLTASRSLIPRPCARNTPTTFPVLTAVPFVVMQMTVATASPALWHKKYQRQVGPTLESNSNLNCILVSRLESDIQNFNLSSP